MNDRLVPSRREFLTWSGAALAGATLASVPFVAGNRAVAADSASSPAQRKRSLRLAHLTDIHVQPELAAGNGMAAALMHAQSLSDPPELILTGGDMVMDVLGVDATRATTQWDLWQKVIKQECSLPVKNCIGNHDVWGWNKTASKTSGKEPGWGKQQSIDKLALPARYYRFDHRGWRFLVLDSIFPDPKKV
jgi:3',5'-cyclic AMP phosphodiesterase CpdA